MQVDTQEIRRLYLELESVRRVADKLGINREPLYPICRDLFAEVRRKISQRHVGVADRGSKLKRAEALRTATAESATWRCHECGAKSHTLVCCNGHTAPWSDPIGECK